MTTYQVSEIFHNTVQGEGQHTGFPCDFLRFSKCQLWPSPDKPSATCPWCDTAQLHQGTMMSGEEILSALKAVPAFGEKGLVISGGEPFLQLTEDLLWHILVELRYRWIDIETNGAAEPLPGVIDLINGARRTVFVSCSPKTKFIVPSLPVSQYKVLIPAKSHLLETVEEHRRQYCFIMTKPEAPPPIYLQPVEVGGVGSPETKANIESAVAMCSSGRYRLSLQTHKLINVR